VTLPRVTEVLQDVGLGPDLSMVQPDVLAAALERGKEVHAVCEALVYGYHDPHRVSDAAAPFVSALEKFLHESRFEAVRAEFLVTHAVWRYCGHPDLLGFLNGRRTILDLKTGDASGAAVQVTAYVDAWNAEHPAESVEAGAILHLRDDGTYRLEPVSLPAALPVWRAAVIVWRARRELGR
jgi:hypothetical protein